MKRIWIVLGMATVFVAAGSPGFAKNKDKSGMKKEVTSASVESADFKEVAPGISKAVLWGHGQSGPYGAFTRFAPGTDNGMHTHAHDVWLVVIKGAYLYKDEAGEKRIGSGGFIRVPGGKQHWSGGDKTEGALFYEEGSGKFDLTPVK
jgi:quercetin dioxygenase-like cupin family protein